MATFNFNGKEYKTQSAVKSAQRAWMQRNTVNTLNRAISYFPHFRASKGQVERHFYSTVWPKVAKSIPYLGDYREKFAMDVLAGIQSKRGAIEQERIAQLKAWEQRTAPQRKAGRVRAAKALSNFL